MSTASRRSCSTARSGPPTNCPGRGCRRAEPRTWRIFPSAIRAAASSRPRSSPRGATSTRTSTTRTPFSWRARPSGAPSKRPGGRSRGTEWRSPRTSTEVFVVSWARKVSLRAFEKTTPPIEKLLTQPIRELGLKVEGSPLERFVQQMYRELDAKGIHRFRPQCYLSSEWGCPSGEPIIAIPFYLANPELAELEKEMDHLEDSREIMMYLRHEAGHAFNYAYKLYDTHDWRELFGPFRRPYREDYRPV